MLKINNLFNVATKDDSSSQLNLDQLNSRKEEIDRLLTAVNFFINFKKNILKLDFLKRINVDLDDKNKKEELKELKDFFMKSKYVINTLEALKEFKTENNGFVYNKIDKEFVEKNKTDLNLSLEDDCGLYSLLIGDIHVICKKVKEKKDSYCFVINKIMFINEKIKYKLYISSIHVSISVINNNEKLTATVYKNKIRYELKKELYARYEESDLLLKVEYKRLKESKSEIIKNNSSIELDIETNKESKFLLLKHNELNYKIVWFKEELELQIRNNLLLPIKLGNVIKNGEEETIKYQEGEKLEKIKKALKMMGFNTYRTNKMLLISGGDINSILDVESFFQYIDMLTME